MNNLYSDLAAIYEAMYTTFIDYESEYRLYSDLLNKYGKTNVLELGCGTGNLSQFFTADNYAFRGLDRSYEMLEIAKQRNPDGIFIQGDIRAFSLQNMVQSTIMVGRTISYLVSNTDIHSSLKCINNNLMAGGILCFDFIDANKFIPSINADQIITHLAQYENQTYVRESKWRINPNSGWCFDWESTFFRKKTEGLIKIGQDSSTIRTFTKDEIKLFLDLNKFEILEIFEKESYAFPTQVVVAVKAPSRQQ